MTAVESHPRTLGFFLFLVTGRVAASGQAELWGKYFSGSFVVFQ
ncbi:hypothetical protein ABIE27_005714 [Paenibacillus sp. 4624]